MKARESASALELVKYDDLRDATLLDIVKWDDTSWLMYTMNDYRWLCRMQAVKAPRDAKSWAEALPPIWFQPRRTLAKTKSPSLNVSSLLHPKTQKNETEVSLTYVSALLFQSVLWVIMMLSSSIMTSVPTLANVTITTWRTVHTFFGNITTQLLAYSYLAGFNQSSRWW
jgi:hypothetical protein